MSSELIVRVWAITRIEPIPGADNVESAVFGGWQCMVPKGRYKAGDLAVYVPPDSLVPGELSDRLGVTKYLDEQRVRAQKFFKGKYISMGLVIENEMNWPEGTDVKEHYGISKYLPPTRGTISNMAGTGAAGGPIKPLKNHPKFFKYSSPQNLRYYPDAFENGEQVVITEKIHGSNIRTGIVDGEWMSGSHEVQRLMPTKYWLESSRGLVYLWRYLILTMYKIYGFIHAKIGMAVLRLYLKLPLRLTMSNVMHKLARKTRKLWNKIGVGKHMASFQEADKYWTPYTIPEVREMLEQINVQCGDVIIYGELFGPGIQKLEYGSKGLSFRAFDLRINGAFVDFDTFYAWCDLYNVPRAPVLYKGPYNGIESVSSYGAGPSTIDGAGHIREGFVIKSLIEGTHPAIGRKICKYIGDQYYAWKDGKADLDTVDV
jgi:RNA ligase (TIGR02306 family)